MILANSHVPGITMRRSTRGIIALNPKLSLSHDPATGQTVGVLLGCSSDQITFIVRQIKTCIAYASHPLLLPCLFSTHHHDLLDRQRKYLWEQLLQVETVSGQTGAPVVNLIRRKSSGDLTRREFSDTIKGILGVVQLATGWESHTNALILGIEVIKDAFPQIIKATPDSRKASVDSATRTLLEYLQLVGHKSKVMLWDLQYISTRAQAQTNAVSILGLNLDLES
jgi:hypothetical protein